MTDERLSEIRARAEKATLGPWEWDSYNSIHAPEQKIDHDGEKWCKVIASIPDHPTGEDSFLAEQITERSAWYRESAANADLIAHARTDIPDLLDEIGRLKAELRGTQ